MTPLLNYQYKLKQLNVSQLHYINIYIYIYSLYDRAGIMSAHIIYKVITDEWETVNFLVKFLPPQ